MTHIIIALALSTTAIFTVGMLVGYQLAMRDSQRVKLPEQHDICGCCCAPLNQCRCTRKETP